MMGPHALFIVAAALAILVVGANGQCEVVTAMPGLTNTAYGQNGCVQFLEPQDGFVTLVTTNRADALEADTTVTVDYGNGNVRVQTVASPPRTVSYAGSILQISWVGTADNVQFEYTAVLDRELCGSGLTNFDEECDHAQSYCTADCHVDMTYECVATEVCFKVDTEGPSIKCNHIDDYEVGENSHNWVGGSEDRPCAVVTNQWRTRGIEVEFGRNTATGGDFAVIGDDQTASTILPDAMNSISYIYYAATSRFLIYFRPDAVDSPTFVEQLTVEFDSCYRLPCGSALGPILLYSSLFCCCCCCVYCCANVCNTNYAIKNETGAAAPPGANRRNSGGGITINVADSNAGGNNTTAERRMAALRAARDELRAAEEMERKSSGKTKDPDALPDYTNAVDMAPGALGGGGGFGGFGGDEAPPLYDEVVRL